MSVLIFIFNVCIFFFYSLVRLALSSNFPGGLLSAAQSYPSLAPNAQNALTLSLTSTSSESEQVTVAICSHFIGVSYYYFLYTA